MIVSLIVAMDSHNGIGFQNQLLCHLPADLAYFKRTTTGHPIIMGRKTFESIGRPLPNRTNIVVSREAGLQIEGCIVKTSLQEAIEYAKTLPTDEVFITGGGTIYQQSMDLVTKAYITRIHHQFEADTFFPELSGWRCVQTAHHEPDEKNNYGYSFEVYEKLI